MLSARSPGVSDAEAARERLRREVRLRMERASRPPPPWRRPAKRAAHSHAFRGPPTSSAGLRRGCFQNYDNGAYRRPAAIRGGRGPRRAAISLISPPESGGGLPGLAASRSRVLRNLWRSLFHPMPGEIRFASVSGIQTDPSPLYVHLSSPNRRSELRASREPRACAHPGRRA